MARQNLTQEITDIKQGPALYNKGEEILNALEKIKTYYNHLPKIC